MAHRKTGYNSLFGTCLFFVSLAVVSLGSKGEALTIYRLGGADLPAPELVEGADFQQLLWEDVDDDQLGMVEALQIHPGFIAPENVDSEVSLTPPMGDGFTLLSGGEWRRPESLPGWFPQRFAVLVLDRDEQTFYSADHNEVFLFDLGRQVHLERVSFSTRQFSNRIIPRFILGTNDGDQSKDGTRLYAPEQYGYSRDTGRFDFDIAHEGSGSRDVEINLPSTPTRRLFLQVFAQGFWEMVDFEIYGRGHVPFARYTSSVIDLGEKFNLGSLIWSGQQTAGSQVELRMRSGDDDDPNTYWRKTFRGNEQVPYNSSGNALSRRQYNRLELAEVGDITHDLDNWSAWSAVYDFAAGQGRVTADRPRRFVQFDVAFLSTPEAGGQLDYLQFATSPRLVTQARGEITPAQAAADAVTSFTCRFRPRLEVGDTGFDGIAIDTPALVDTVAGVESVSLGGVEMEFTTTRLDEHGFAVQIPRIGLERTEELFAINFRAQVFAYDTPFVVRLLDTETPFEVPQQVLEGDADEAVDSNTLRVALSRIPQRPIQTMRLSSPIFSPNGDGINDVVHIEYELLNLSGGAPARIAVYDLSGRQVGEILGDDGGSSGLSQARWDGRDGGGALVAPGLYVLQLEIEADSGADRNQRLISLVY